MKMNKKNEVQDITKSMIILPRLLNYFLGNFKPQFDIAIKKNEIKTLLELDVNPNMPMKHYIDAVDMEKGSFTYLADKLEEKGLIERVHAKEDRRKITLSLTEDGSALARELQNQFHNHVTELIGVLGEEALEDLRKATYLLDKVYKRIEQVK